MPVLALIAQIIGPLAGIIPNLHTSDAEKLTLQAELTRIQNEFAAKGLEYEQAIMAARADIIKAEAQGNSWIQRNWRPCTMFTFLALTVCDSFGWLPNPLAPQAWTLLQLGLGGYVVGRSIEKIAPSMVAAARESKGA
jgi:hypothetical protein